MPGRVLPIFIQSFSQRSCCKKKAHIVSNPLLYKEQIFSASRVVDSP